MAERIRTVLGDISPGELGITLMHEHLLCDLTCLFEPPPQVTARRLAGERVDIENLGVLHRNPFAIRDNLLLDDVELAAQEIKRFRWAGGNTVVEATCVGMGRDVAGLRRIAVETGLNIVAGCGYYVDSSHPPYLETRSVDEITAELVDEIEGGIEGTGIRPGIIGEIGTSQQITPTEEKVLRAAARAQAETGLPVSVHPYFRDGKWHALEILDILEAEGADPGRVIICHMDGNPDVEYGRSVARRGAYIEYDTFGKEYTRTDKSYELPKDTQRVKSIQYLAQEGFVDRILLSQDVCFKMDLHRYGGWGYDHILTNVLPMFHAAGTGDDTLHRILEVNPAKALSITK
ncbi:MAG: phosphotriesterase-related protein [Deltaproteobacteria bacterium]|nr:phosphotriesterase-related protein [Deltaproteobacteria bacterium]MBW2123101.1 phosphotriesterase-related protein [Deltaproteobacteria bacterium]